MKVEKIVNLTPHPVNIQTDSNTIEIPPSGKIARCVESITELEPIEYQEHHIKAQVKSFGKIENLSGPEDGVIYVVSLPVAQATKNRRDVFTIGDAIRNEKGQVIGAKTLAIIQ
jgi:hypothetical protein